MQEDIHQEGIAITGEKFRETIGPFTEVYDQRCQEFRIDFTDDKRFHDVQGRLKIMARATAEDKFILISGVK